MSTWVPRSSRVTETMRATTLSDATGDLFISDQGNHRIREVLAPGPGLSLTNVNSSLTGSFDVVISSPYGSVTSSSALRLPTA